MNVTVTRRRAEDEIANVVRLAHVVEVVVEPVDPDNRTQAERNAQNALDAARLRRVEAGLHALLKALDDLGPMAVRLDRNIVRQNIERALEAPVA